MAELYHYGTKRHSGRYPWGSGEDPYQHESGFLNTVNELKNKGLSETEIAKALGISTTELRRRKSLEKEQLKAAERAYIIELKNRGYSNVAIAEKIGKGESYVRYVLDPVVKERAEVTQNIADVLKANIDSKNYIDIGAGTELYLGVSKEKLNVAIQKLQDEEGYNVYYLKVPQAGIPGQYTWVKVLAKPDATWSEVNQHKDEIGFVSDFYSEDGGKTFLGIQPPTSIDSSRLQVNYKEDGGDQMDGVIQLRRGVEDISLGGANYAQVRIAVDGTHYIKGMAIYSDDMPDGIDIIFNTNKHQGTPILGADKNNSVLKPLKSDPDNPFGTTLRMEDGVIVGQRTYIDENGETKLSPINIVRQEGDWNTWSNTLASQFLSKQPEQLIRQQLNKSQEDRESEYQRILQVTQPEVRRNLLNSFADDCDSAASELKAAALPRQSNKVLLPVTDISDKEVYAPTYRDGEKVALIRYPHAGIFEIPVLTVNNKSKSAEKIISKNAVDAIGINPKVASQLSGADFDGDTVLVIPTANQKIKAGSPLDSLIKFDPKESYPAVKGMKVMTKKNTQNEMGKISNLITDMTIKGASQDEIVRAVKHSMVVIDAEKHKLNYEQSYQDNGIAELKEKYQGGKNKGASTLLSKANADKRVPVRKETVNKKTGEKEYDYNVKDSTYMKPKKNSKGEVVKWEETQRTVHTTWMKDEKDARNLSSGTLQEELYANYANSLKSMANSARKEAYSTPTTKVNSSAKKTYEKEVSSLNSKLNTALKNAPKERKAQMIADTIIKAKKKSNPDMDADELKKVQTQALSYARNKTGASKSKVSINLTKEEWDAINSGALSSSKVSQIIANTNKDLIKQYALPNKNRTVSTSEEARIRSLANNGYTLSEIADSIGVSATTVSNVLSGKE